MDFTDCSNIGKEYKGFVVVSIEDVPDYKSKAVYLRHKTTGLEIFHLVNDDKENLFSFCFRTLAKNSKGTAHIIEHSTLCGSEKFPLKEPFTTLDNQSVKTFLNAMTYPEKTLYPAASVVQSDYFNLMDVYADAVFFPKISRQTFMQEGWRVELDENGKPSIQGVVYNEMKANYSTFNQIAMDELFTAIYPDSILAYDSGGDPLEIPTLTYEEFKAFHHKFYSPNNCLLFLYGNLPTSVQIDFIAEKYIPRLEQAYGVLENLDIVSKTPIVNTEFMELQKYNRITETKEVHAIAPDNGASGNMVATCWYSGKDNMEQYFLSEVLTGNDSSPMSRKLKDSELGEDEAPINGNYSYVLNETIFGFGLSGVKKKNEKKVFELIQKSIKEIYEEGVSQEDIDSAIMGIDFALREVNRFWGPRSINIASKVAAGWCVGREPSNQLSPITSFEEVKKQARENPDYVKSLIKKYFLDNDLYLNISVEPSAKYFEKRKAKEAELIREIESKLNKEELKVQLDELHAYQEKIETEEELSCIPHLKVKDLDSRLDEIKTEYTTVKGADGSDVPVIINKEDTNGIVYAEILYPIDNLNQKYYLDFPLFTGILTNLGWNGKPWDVCTAEAACLLGDINVKTNISMLGNTEQAKENVAKYENKNIAGRNWINFSAKFLSDVTDKTFDLLAEILTTMSFDDKKHMETRISEYINDKKENFVGSASNYIGLYGRSGGSKNCAVQEIFWGVTQIMHILKLKKSDAGKLLSQYEKMYKDVVSQGAVIHIIADEGSLDKVLKLLPDFAKKAGITELKPSENIGLEAYLPYIYRPKNYDENKIDIIQAKTQSGFSNLYFPCSKWLTKEQAAEDVLASYLNGHQLWEKIRMKGGAYGGRCWADSTMLLFGMASWRDPTPEKTLELYVESLKEAVEYNFTEEDVERCILSEYSDYIMPDSPVNRGNRGLARYFVGTTNEMLQKGLDMLLQVKPEDVHAAAVRLYEASKNAYKKIIFCDKSEKKCGNIISIPL